jgi:RHS repeat-associated protein
LLNTARKNGTVTTERWGFNYDALGNVLKLDDQVGTSDATLTYLTTDRDQVCNISYASTLNGCNVIYDRFGNVTNEPTRTGYDKLRYFNTGDVRSITDQSGVTASFTYDPFGEEHGLDIASSTTVLRKERHFGAFITQRTQKNTAYVARQFPGPGLTISRHGANGPWVFQFAEPSGTRFTVDEKGNFLQDVHYTPFGQAMSTGAVAGDATFTTEQWNGGDALDGFGLVQVGKRIYDPAVGRFLSRDPLLIPRTAATTNPYAFALNDPTNLSDPSGLDPCAGNLLCISSSVGGDDDANLIVSAATLGVLAANFVFSGGDEPPMMSSSAPQMAAYSAAFDGQMAQHRLSSVTSELRTARVLRFRKLGFEPRRRHR